MRWDMETEEVEAVLEKIWDLHDKLSDAIHSISRTHFLNSLTGKKQPPAPDSHPTPPDNIRESGFVFVKDFSAYDEAIQEARSLNSIRSALERLEDQLEFFHNVQIQQRAERDGAIARLEHSRIVLAMRLADHHGKKYKVIEEARAFVGDVRETSRDIFPENTAGYNSVNPKRSIMMRVLVSSLKFAKNSFRLDHVGGILGNAALVAITLVALLNINQASENNHNQRRQIDICGGKRLSSKIQGGTSSKGNPSQLNVMLARG